MSTELPIRVQLDVCSAHAFLPDGSDCRIVADNPLMAVAQLLMDKMGCMSSQRIEIYRDGSDESWCTTVGAAGGLN